MWSSEHTAHEQDGGMHVSEGRDIGSGVADARAQDGHTRFIGISVQNK